MTLYEELVARGLIAQVTNEEEIKSMINEGKATFYIGFDPTADSLHVGHFMALQQAHRPDWRRYRYDWGPLWPHGHAVHDDPGNH